MLFPRRISPLSPTLRNKRSCSAGRSGSFPWHLRRATQLAKCLMPKTVSVYGYHSDYGRQRLTGECAPTLITQAENELRFLREAVECGFADDFEI